MSELVSVGEYEILEILYDVLHFLHYSDLAYKIAIGIVVLQIVGLVFIHLRQRR